MKKILALLLVCNSAFAQQVKIIKIGEESAANTAVNIYNVRIYNNTNKPICIPVSNDFAYRLNDNDTLELGDITSDKDSEIVVSLFWSKQDLAIDPQQMASYPVVLNPRTYLVTNISLEKSPTNKAIYFEFMHAFGPDLDFQKISASYESEPKFMWRQSLKFLEDRFPMEH